MKVLCVQCLKLNALQDTVPPGQDGKVRFPCPHCGFVTVVTRRAAKKAPEPAPPARKSDPRQETNTGAHRERARRQAASENTNPQANRKSLHDELFDGSEEKVGDWMVRRLDGTEAGPLTFESLREMIREGDIGKIDEVRRLEERYVPAAFHELTAELFNELDMAGMAPPRKG